MGHVENKVRWCIKKAEKEGDKHRGLKKVDIDETTIKNHISKAEHNLNTMIYSFLGLIPRCFATFKSKRNEPRSVLKQIVIPQSLLRWDRFV